MYSKLLTRFIFTSMIAVGCFFSVSAQYRGGQKSVVRAGRPVHITKTMMVESAVSIGNSVIVDGRVTQDAVAVGGSVTINPGAVVGGSAVSVGGTVNEFPGAVVRGDIVEIAGGFADMFGPGFEKVWWGVALGFSILMFVGFTALALLLAAILPRQLERVSAAIGDQPLKTFLWGLLVVVLIVPVAIVLVVSIIGIVLVPVEIAAVILACVFGYIAVARIVGHRFILALKRPETPMIWEVLIGLVILWLAGLIPIAGGVLKVVVTIFGLGGIVEAIRGWKANQHKGSAGELGKREVKA